MKLPAELDTMSGRIFMLLLVGIALAGTLGVVLSEQRRVAEVRHIQAVRALERLSRFIGEIETSEKDRRKHETREARTFVRLAQGGDEGGIAAPDLVALLAPQLPPGVTATVTAIPVARCAVPADRDHDKDDHDKDRDGDHASDPDSAASESARAWRAVVEATDCWRIAARLSDGSDWSFVTGPPPLLKASYGPDPAFLSVILVAGAALALLVARIAGGPIRTLTRAAASIVPEVSVIDLPEAGPADVRGAIRAFNDMRVRLARHAIEQTHMIAAITHDLQTPMTRMRLKLEQIDDVVWRDRLLSDWHAMRAIVEEGLELAHSTDAREPLVLLDIDSLIDSIVEDERDAGNLATFDASAGRDWVCRPRMLRRCVQNLVDNAIKHGDEAHLSTHDDADGLRIVIRDAGPGIPAHQIDAVFEPMVRLETSRSRETGGTGLGLTIARNLAQRMGATLTLENAEPHGLVCTIRFRAAASVASTRPPHHRS
ncbi:sensor histidine kinase [Sphingomonas nostoxanthinifaciens]|uniref:sensor histidine kinase n=1 Tax=Sphingomonas nostoxanthinifaciens TaxID=2872652 RepID=UPI001CC1FBCF|nr:HAMP domain-containing sensor histidine kinase [Sphingomonas nostoxanthinifaciens]UAK23927.1 HAMP domain-containing histidine kinase [Sphingomonas nostoxanthinifaciens]